MSRDYNGTFSAQRQELVEQWVHYAVLTDEAVGMLVQPTYESLVQVANLSGAVPTPRDVVAGTEDEAIYIGQSMPWIDPMKEALAWEKLVQAGFASEVEVIRRRGGNPRDVIEQVDAFRRETAARALSFSSDFGKTVMGSMQAAADANAEDDERETAATKAGSASSNPVLPVETGRVFSETEGLRSEAFSNEQNAIRLVFHPPQNGCSSRSNRCRCRR